MGPCLRCLRRTSLSVSNVSNVSRRVAAMARWTVTDGYQEIVIESVQPALVSVDIPTGGPFITGAEGIRDLRTKLGLAIGDAQGGEEPHRQDPGGHSPVGESDV